MKGAAILIGLNTYPRASNLGNLKGTINDCEDVAQALVKHGLIDPAHVYAYVHDTNASNPHVPDAQPLVEPNDVPPSGIVPATILNQRMFNVINQLGKDGVERLFVYLSGHGGDLRLALPPVSVLYTTDFVQQTGSPSQGMIVTEHIQNIVHNAVGIKDAVIISDSCRNALPALTDIPAVPYRPQFKVETRCVIIKSAIHDTSSIEDNKLKPGRYGGIFTYLLLQELDNAMQNPGPVHWRDICDKVAVEQAKHGSQRLDYRQVTAYPLMEVRPAPPATAPTVPTLTLKPTAPATPTSATRPNTGQGSFNPMPSRPRAKPAQFGREASFGGGITIGFRPMMAGKRWTTTAVTPHRQQGVKVVSGAVATPPQRPVQVDLMEIYRRRPLINGMIALQSTFGYLSSSEQKQLQRATQILASEGDPRALESLNDTLTEKQWASLTSFLRHQAHSADPLSTLDAQAQDDGFTLKVTGVTPTKSDSWRVELQVDGADARVKPSTVRVYQHPSLLPVVQDVPFTDGAAPFVLILKYAFTVAVKVDSGPLLKLDLTSVGLPLRPETV